MGKIATHQEIGQKIRTFRQQAGLSQEKLAEALEITFQQVQKYERGVTKVNLIKLQEIADIFKVPVSAFFEESHFTACQHTEREIVLLKAFRGVREDHLQKSIIDVVTGLSKRKS